MTDEQIAEIATKMYAGGFGGVVAWHHYAEPLLAWPRIRSLIQQILAASPQARFLLWTNGDYFGKIPAQEICGIFDTIVVSNYAKRDLTPYREYSRVFHELPGNLDWRLNPPTVPPSTEPKCSRPFLEITFDYYGNVRTCCNDWNSSTSVGNIHDTPFEELWQRWVKQRDAIARMGQDAPQRCLTCGTRYVHLADYVPEAAERTREYLRSMT